MTPNTIKTVLVGIAALIFAALGWFAWRAIDPSHGTGPAVATAPQPKVETTERPSQTPAAEATATPSDQNRTNRVGVAFDIVRIEPSGEAVVAGRATPGATVELLRDGQVIATEKANDAGEFVITPPTLPAGDHQLQLRTQGADAAASERTVVVSIPKDGKGEALVVASEPNKPAEILQQPSPAQETAAAPAVAASSTPQPESTRTDQPLRVGAVEVEGGRLFVQGAGPSGSGVRIHLNNAPVAEATVDPDGKWSLTIEKGMTPGTYAVRADQLDAAGKVVARAETPFDYTPRMADASTGNGAGQAATGPEQAQPEGDLPTAPSTAETTPAAAPPAPQTAPSPANPVVPEVGTVTIKRGDNLWRISRSIYGQGIRYSVIYDANTDQIRDPDLIYPNQVFVVPKASD